MGHRHDQFGHDNSRRALQRVRVGNSRECPRTSGHGEHPVLGPDPEALMGRTMARPARSAGFTLIEIMIAVVFLSVGIIAIAKVFPASSRAQLSARMETIAGRYASETFETLRGLPRTNTDLSVGRHPTTGYDTLGTTRAWRRYYVVSAMPAPLDSLIKLDSRVVWTSSHPESVSLRE